MTVDPPCATDAAYEDPIPLWPDAVAIESLEDAQVEGFVIVCQCAGGSLLMARHDRLAAGVQLWELPRAPLAFEADAEQAAATLLQEVGLRATKAQLLGRFHPDAGSLPLRMDVVLLETADVVLPDPGRDGDGPVLDWVGEDELDLMMMSGSLRDGVSLSALMLWRAWRAGEDALPA